MENTPQQKTELDAKASAVAAMRKQLDARFQELYAMQKDLEAIATLEVRDKQMEEDIAKRIAALKIEIPK